LIQGLRWFLMELRLLFGSMHSQAGAWERGKLCVVPLHSNLPSLYNFLYNYKGKERD
jgi:hypothetical protein